MPRARRSGSRPSCGGEARERLRRVHVVGDEHAAAAERGPGRVELEPHAVERVLAVVHERVDRRRAASSSGGSSSWLRPSTSVQRSFSSAGISQPGSDPDGMPARPTPS